MRFLHTMLRVGNLQRSIDFYTQVLGMTLLRTSENPEYKYSLAFLGFDGGNPGQAEIELTWNWGEAGPVKGGTTVIAFVTDPDGYKIELIQRAEHGAGGGLR